MDTNLQGLEQRNHPDSFLSKHFWRSLLALQSGRIIFVLSQTILVSSGVRRFLKPAAVGVLWISSFWLNYEFYFFRLKLIGDFIPLHFDQSFASRLTIYAKLKYAYPKEASQLLLGNRRLGRSSTLLSGSDMLGSGQRCWALSPSLSEGVSAGENEH